MYSTRRITNPYNILREFTRTSLGNSLKHVNLSPDVIVDYQNNEVNYGGTVCGRADVGEHAGNELPAVWKRAVLR